ncbi:MAG: ArnT family glycosyltransferase [Gemmataceae bacterium]
MRLLTSLTLVAAAWLFLAGLGGRELYSSHEARAAMNAVSLLDGEPLPRLYDGTRDLQKPPLYYALVALAGWAGGGVDGWAVRLPAALSGLGVVALLLAVGWRVGRPAAGVFAALVLVTTVHFPWLARIGRIDMPLALTVSVAGASFLMALRGEHGWLWLAYPACAAGVLLKGPIGLVLPGAVVAAMLLAEGRWPAVWEGRAWLALLRELAVVPGLASVAAVTVPAFLWTEHASGGQFFHEFFWLHNVQRGLGGSRLRAHPWWLYVPYLMLYLLPATPLLAWGLFSRARRDPLARAGLAWLIGVVVVLSAAKFKRADYLLPAYPGAALFLGCVLERWARRRPRLVVGGAAAVAAGALAGWAVYLTVHLPADAPFRDYRPLAALIRRHGAEEVLFFRAEAHALLYRVGRPARVLVQWDELRGELTRPRLVVVPAKLVDEVRQLAPIEVLGGTEGLAGGRHERPLVALRVGGVRAAHAAAAE